MKAGVIGVVLWDDNNEPIKKAKVDVFEASSGRTLAEDTTDGQGRFKMQFDLGKTDDPCACEVFFIVTSRKGERLLSTKDLPTRLSASQINVQLAVPHVQRPEEREHNQRPTVHVGDFDLDAAVFEKAEPKLVLEIALAVVDRDFEKRIRDKLGALSPEIVPSEHSRHTLSDTAILELIEEIIRIKQWPRTLRLKVDDILRLRRRDTDWPEVDPGPSSGFTEQVHLCPNFRITYQDSGPAAVDPDTSAQDVNDPGNPTPTVLATLPAGGPPTYIKRICFWLERALAAYISPPFSLRNPAAGGRIEVVVNTSAFGSAGATTFFINNTLPPDVLCAVAVHELFHMVQFQYSGGGTWRSGMTEGGAVWAEDSAAEFMNRYLDEAGTNFNGSGYMVQPHVSLEDSGFRYKTSLFWRYIAEQQSPRINAGDEPKIGVEVYREIIERCESGGWSSDAIKTAIRNLPWYQDFYEFGYLDAARQDLTGAETVMGNFALAAYLKDLGVNVPDRRFDFMEDEENIFIDDVIATVIPGTPLQTTLATVLRAGTGTVTSTASASFTNTVPRFGSRYFEVTVDPGVTSVQLQFTAAAGLTSVLFQAALIDEDNLVREIYRSDRTSYSKRFPNLRDSKRLNRIALVVTGGASAGSFTVSASPAVAASDVMVTRWHSVMKTEYEIDSRNWAWTWVSPDIFVDNDLDGLADGTVFFSVNNKLNIRLHNKGNLDATNIGVEFWYQDASGGLSTAWLPVVNTGGTIQSLSGLSLAQGASNVWSVDWAPAPSGMSHHFCVRAIVTVSGDPNTDNKRVLSNFGNVQVSFRGFRDFSILRRHLDLERVRNIELFAVPRFRQQFELAARDLREQRVKTLKPGEISVDELRIYHRPVQGEITRTSLPRRRKSKEPPCPCAAPLPQLGQEPDLSGDYPVDPRTLPPGLADKPMVTLVHRADGQVIGGVTLMLSVDEKQHGPKG
jgi:hypothetical protein